MKANKKKSVQRDVQASSKLALVDTSNLSIEDISENDTIQAQFVSTLFVESIELIVSHWFITATTSESDQSSAKG